MIQIKKYDFKNEKNNIVGSLELEKNKLYIYGDIVMDSFFKCEETEDICPKDIIEFLKDLENKEDIEIHINSGGGSVFGGLAIYNLLKTYKGKKSVYIDGLAGSIASVIALAGDEVYAFANSIFMIHNPLTAICGYYNAKELQEQISSLEKCKKAILNVYMRNLSMFKHYTEKVIENLMDDETWLVGNDIAEYFNVRVISQENEIVACTSNYFEKYKNMPEIMKNTAIENDLQEKQILNDNLKEKEQILSELEKISIF